MSLDQKACEILVREAKEKYEDKSLVVEDGDIDIDPDAKVSAADSSQDMIEANGAYVQAWVWVSFNNLSKDQIKAILGKDYDAYVKFHGVHEV